MRPKPIHPGLLLVNIVISSCPDHEVPGDVRYRYEFQNCERDFAGMEGWRNGRRVQYSVKQKVTEAVEERTGMRWRRVKDEWVIEGGNEVAIINDLIL